MEKDAHKGKRKPWTLREFGGQTVWAWLHLLSALAIPVVLAVAGLYFEAQLDERQRSIENQRAQAERELAEQRAQDEALQAYLDQMSQLMLDRKLLEAQQGDPVYTLAQARTSTVILALDAEHNESVTRFLIISGLAGTAAEELSISLLRDIELSGAELSEGNIAGANLSEANLSEANLSRTYGTGANLIDANLMDAELSEANLSWANLSEANLENAELRSTSFVHADLSGAYLDNADLSGAFLDGTKLREADPRPP